jgi:hypothetical protein
MFMKIKSRVNNAFIILAMLAGISRAEAQGTLFTYQGSLNTDAAPANGFYDFKFSLYTNSTGSGTQVGSTITQTAIGVTNGLFTTRLDFGAVFTGNATWMAISVRSNGVGSYTPMTPLEELTPSPYAVFANTASNLSGTLPAAQLSGAVGNGQLADSSITVSAGPGLTGGGTVALGGSTTLSNAGVVSVTGNADITASTVLGGVTLGDTATSADTANLIVKRDGTGSFSTENITLDGALHLPSTAVSDDIIYSGGTLLLYGDDKGNFFTGQQAGNSSTTGTDNTANGVAALSGNTTGSDNTAIGNAALQDNMTGTENTAIGVSALQDNTSGGANTATGDYANLANTTGSQNTAIGYDALRLNTTGSNNIALGYGAGFSLTTGNNNIDIGNEGVSTDTNIIRIGAGQSQAFLAGVYGSSSASAVPVMISSTGQLGTVGTLPSSDFAGTYANAVNLDNAGNSFAGNGSGLTSLNASDLTLGTVPDSVLNPDVALLDRPQQAFTGSNTFAGNPGSFLINNGFSPISTNLFTGLGLQYSGTYGEGAIMSSYNDGEGYLSFYTKQGSGSPVAKQMIIDYYGGLAIDQQGYNNGVINNGTSNGVGLTFGIGSGEGIASKRTAGGNQYGLDFYTAFVNHMSLANTGNLELNGNDLYLEGGGDSDYGLGYRSTFAGVPDFYGPLLWGFDGGALGTVGPDEVSLTWDFSGNIWISNNLTVGGNYAEVVGGNAYNGNGPIEAYIGGSGSGSDVQIGSENPNILNIGFWNTGASAYMHIYCSSITINGGADLAEPFAVSGPSGEIPQGSVVVIDDQNPGHLKVSSQAYDTRVAGVLSGANGINPGIQMQQQALVEGGKNVALTGRVYALADAGNGAINPGDLLTTSDTPGHAMKVSDHARASGAILGKAMSGLKEGKGMVLVLVTLQ